MIDNLYRKFNIPKLIVSAILLAVYVFGVHLAGQNIYSTMLCLFSVSLPLCFSTSILVAVVSDSIADMCKTNNIRYVLYSSQFEGETSALDNFQIVFNDRTVKIYKIY